MNFYEECFIKFDRIHNHGMANFDLIESRITFL